MTMAPAPVFEVRDPRSGEVVAAHPETSAAEVAATVARARTAAAWWGDLGWDGRRAHLRAWSAVLGRRQGDLAAAVQRENGKTVDDALLEIALAQHHLAWAAANARRVLGARRVPSGLLAANQQSWLEYQPLGVVGVIGPWNYPVFTPMGSIAYALAAGNAVVFKPSEYTPGAALVLAATLAEAVPDAPAPLLSVVTGRGATGAALCRSGVDKLAFTGSARTGRAVMAACAENLTPVVMECGGKDALIVDDGADVAAAAEAALWGGMSNAGQTCVGIERVYATDAVYEPFVAALADRARAVRPATPTGYGPITMPGQLTTIGRHIDEALARGARAVVGGRGAVRGRWVDPTVLVDVPDDAAAMREETFGPTLTVTRVRDADEAVRRANDSGYGLGGSVFAATRRRGMALARRLRGGMTSVNSVMAFAAVPALPFGGVGESGFGRVHGDDGLREFGRAKAVTVQRFALPVPVMSFSRSPGAVASLARAAALLARR